jgi:hypothetical protein
MFHVRTVLGKTRLWIKPESIDTPPYWDYAVQRWVRCFAYNPRIPDLDKNHAFDIAKKLFGGKYSKFVERWSNLPGLQCV